PTTGFSDGWLGSRASVVHHLHEGDRAMSRDERWIFRTYAGFATPAATNERFKTNLAKGQTGLSVAFDLPTQTGYDSDSPMARGEVGRVGVPICHLGDMRTLLEGLPVEDMN